VNGALRQRLGESARTEGDVDDGGVLDEHRDHHLATRAEVGDRVGEARTGLGELVAGRADDVVHDEVVSAAK
jgi:hypothetical protein